MKRIVLIALATLSPLVIFSPSLVSLLWHARHGNSIEYAGKRIPVPPRWYAHIESHSVQLSRPPLTVFSLEAPSPVWSFLRPSPAKPTVSQAEIYKSFEDTYWTLHAEAGDAVSGPIRIQTNEDEAVCMKASSPRNNDKVYVSCLMFRGTWMAEFVGDANEIGKFFQVISGMSSVDGG